MTIRRQDLTVAIELLKPHGTFIEEKKASTDVLIEFEQVNNSADIFPTLVNDFKLKVSLCEMQYRFRTSDYQIG